MLVKERFTRFGYLTRSRGFERDELKGLRLVAHRRKISRFDCRGYEQELFEGHSCLAKAALTENERVELEHFVGDGRRQCGRCRRFRKCAWFASWNLAAGYEARPRRQISPRLFRTAGSWIELMRPCYSLSTLFLCGRRA